MGHPVPELQRQPGRLRGLPSRKCVDVDNSDTTGPGAPSVIFTCDYPGTKNDNTGQRWIAETDPYGDIRLRNEATHLCLTAPDAEIGQVAVEVCSTSPRQVWEPEP
ncbi:RICIN domain-containing protein [Streptomyces mirabilis]|uniref:RICIN domain-containing protein n=1 Tax=Streptomyces mirabilis TaxID=68239 RepID=UPI003676F1B7